MDASLLDLWERALPLAPAARERLLALDAEGSAPASVGAQRHRLLGRLAQRLGPRLALRCRCPACGSEAGFDVDLPALIEATAGGAGGRERRLEHGAWQVRFRLPAPDELPLDEPDPDAFVARLLERCVTEACEDGAPRSPRKLPSPLLDALSRRMDALDPGAHIAFDVVCPACGTAWSAPFDPGTACWTLIDEDAGELLLDVDTLAARYGWSEAAILALPAQRRRAYLRLARGA